VTCDAARHEDGQGRYRSSDSGRILNHKERGIIRVYNRYQFDKEKQQAWTLWARKLTRILSNLKAVNWKA
jgi:hypothetical protein